MAHGTATSYRSGCRCGECRQAQRERQRAYRAGDLGRVAGLPSAAAPVPAEGESVTAALRRDLADMPEIAPKRATAVATAFALAALLDDPTAGPQKPSAARQLADLMASLRATSSARTGRKSRLTGGVSR